MAKLPFLIFDGTYKNVRLEIDRRPEGRKDEILCVRVMHIGNLGPTVIMVPASVVHRLRSRGRLSPGFPPEFRRRSGRVSKPKVCGSTCSNCCCVLPLGHESPHLCWWGCQGSWFGDDRTGRADPGPIYGPLGFMLPTQHAGMELAWNGTTWATKVRTVERSDA